MVLGLSAQVPLTMTVANFVKLFGKDEIRTSNPIQRPYRWKNNKRDNRQSLLIYSLIMWFSIDELQMNYKTDVDRKKKFYDTIEGKQRGITIYNFVNDKFALQGLEPFPITANGELALHEEDVVDKININGKLFSELPKDFQERIMQFNLHIFYYDNANDETIKKAFILTNNALSLNKVDKSKATTKSINKFMELTEHPVFEFMSDTAKSNNSPLNIVEKAWILLNTKNPSFDKMSETIQDIDFTDDQYKDIEEALNRIYNCHEILIKENTRPSVSVAKTIIVMSHMVNLIIPAYKSIADGIDDGEFCGWLKSFFTGSKRDGVSVSKTYNKFNHESTSSATSIEKRVNSMMNSYKISLKKHQESEYHLISGEKEPEPTSENNAEENSGSEHDDEKFNADNGVA